MKKLYESPELEIYKFIYTTQAANQSNPDENAGDDNKDDNDTLPFDPFE
ncbi:MAG: hypothetical protein IJW04_04950 [Ruminococcus sp.]|nr:hypothetical protein [Ruminococcus sp.]